MAHFFMRNPSLALIPTPVLATDAVGEGRLPRRVGLESGTREGECQSESRTGDASRFPGGLPKRGDPSHVVGQRGKEDRRSEIVLSSYMIRAFAGRLVGRSKLTRVPRALSGQCEFGK